MARPRRRRLAWALAAALTASGAASAACATYSDRTEAARAAVSAGDLQGGEKAVNKLLKVKRSDDLPTKWGSETGLTVLERAMILHALGLYKLSARDLQAAEKQLELLDIARDGAGQIGKYVFSDSATKYKAPPSEKLTLNAINMINYLALGDLSGARVEAKRFTVMRRYFADYDPEHAHGAFGSYLAGFVHERLREDESAIRYYEEALQERGFEHLRAPITRLAARTGFTGPRVRDFLGETPDASPGAAQAKPPEAEILVVVNVGRVPYKVPERIPIGAAIGLAHTYITGDTRVLEHSAFKVVVYPELAPSGAPFEQAKLTVDGQEVALELATNLEADVVAEYEALRPKIIGAAISRLIVRAIAAEGARAAGKQSKESPNLVGFLAAAAVEGAMVAADRPDTRSWTLLPARVYLARIPVRAGHHTLTVDLQGPGGRERRKAEIDVPAAGFAVLDVTSLR
ncbi:MAG: hypothetical protein KC420_12205 [Myxococcales bacterium]|nr:hypothetical protein [Myxococcales bacterium]